MSVLIKGMKMPKYCGECDIEWCTRWKKLIVAGMPIAKSRPSDCPLIELPPHGDLISREQLVDIGLHLMNIAKNDDIANGVKWLWQYVIEAPAILEAEVNHERTD